MSTILTSSRNREGYHTQDKNNTVVKEYLITKPRRELNFTHQKNKYISEITLTNNDFQPVIFKVRTTSSKSYAVLPTIGMVPPRGTSKVEIQMSSTERVRERADDKFLIQAFPYVGDIEENQSLQEIFDLFHKSMSSQAFQNTKLKVHFEINSAIQEELSEDGPPRTAKSSRSASVLRNNDVTISQRSKEESYPTSFFEDLVHKTKVLSSPAPTVRSGYREQVPAKYEIPRDIVGTNVLAGLKEQASEYIAPRKEEKTPTFESMNNIQSKQIHSMREETLKYSPEKDESRSMSYLSIPLKSRTGIDTNDLSRFTGISDFKSARDPSQSLSMYKAKFQSLEQKYKQQKKLLNQLTEEKESYLSKLNALKLSSIATPMEEHNKTVVLPHHGQIELWHILIISIVFLILGSLLK